MRFDEPGGPSLKRRVIGCCPGAPAVPLPGVPQATRGSGVGAAAPPPLLDHDRAREHEFELRRETN